MCREQIERGKREREGARTKAETSLRIRGRKFRRARPIVRLPTRVARGNELNSRTYTPRGTRSESLTYEQRQAARKIASVARAQLRGSSAVILLARARFPRKSLPLDDAIWKGRFPFWVG